MANQYVGYLVSIESKSTFYQGIVSFIDLNKNTIQLKNTYKNGIKYSDNLIEIKNEDIDNIEIVADPDKAKIILNNQNKIENGTRINQNNAEKKPNGKNNSSVNTNINPELSSKPKPTTSQEIQKNKKPDNKVKQQQLTPSPKQRKLIEQNNNINYHNLNHGDSENCFNSVNVDLIADDFDFEKNLALFNKEKFYQEMNTNTNQQQPTTTTLATNNSVNYLNNNTFSNITSNTTTTTNNNNKQNEVKPSQPPYYQQLSLETLFPSLNLNTNSQTSNQTTPLSTLPSSSSTTTTRTAAITTTTGKNYRCDEMILDTGEPVEYNQIHLPIPPTKQYVTDEGLFVPCITNELKHRLFDESYKLGYSKQRQIECIGRCCTEMVLQLLGGPTRFLPKNNHQKPKVLVLANTEIQGAYAICTARLLSIRNVHVYLFMNNTNTIAAQIDSECVQTELKLLNLSEAKIIKSVDEIQNFAIDLIINAIDSGNNISINSQLWYRNLVKYCSTSKASVLSIDPPPDGSAIESKWSIVPILPQAMTRNCGRIYLCDLGFSKKVFDSVNIKYQSPFGAKFMIPLHND